MHDNICSCLVIQCLFFVINIFLPNFYIDITMCAYIEEEMQHAPALMLIYICGIIPNIFENFVTTMLEKCGSTFGRVDVLSREGARETSYALCCHPLLLNAIFFLFTPSISNRLNSGPYIKSFCFFQGFFRLLKRCVILVPSVGQAAFRHQADVKRPRCLPADIVISSNVGTKR